MVLALEFTPGPNSIYQSKNGPEDRMLRSELSFHPQHLGPKPSIYLHFPLTLCWKHSHFQADSALDNSAGSFLPGRCARLATLDSA